jgi:hypothetical protein
LHDARFLTWMFACLFLLLFVVQPGSPDQCNCYNPTIGNPLDMNPGVWELWNTTFEITKEIAAVAASRQSTSSLELVLLGDSISEHWRGTSLGRPQDKLIGHAKAFQELFVKENGGKINAVSLGISAERVSF